LRIPALLALLLVSAANAQTEAELADVFEQSQIVIVSSARACYSFDVFLARSFPQRRRGLMHVRELPAMNGMLFVYEHADVHSMWMKNTYISLDILFVRDDGSIANIAAHTEPLSLESIASVEPVNYVLELNAGTATRLGIDENSRIWWQGMYSNAD